MSDPRAPIAIDITPAVRQRAGIGRYARELTCALLARGRHRYTLFVADLTAGPQVDALQAASGNRPRPGVRVVGLPHRLLTLAWHRLRLPLPAEKWLGEAALFHVPDFLAPPLKRTPSIITIHDLSFLRLPERAQPGLYAYLSGSLPAAARSAAHILADSEHTKAEAIDLLGVDEALVSVAYPGVGQAFTTPCSSEEVGRVRVLHGLERPFVLGVGTLEPRKDWPVLIEAFGELGDAGRGHDLVIAGAPGWLMDEIRAAVASAGRRVRLLGFVPDEDLRALYAGCTVFVYPSVYEGFGLPALEALAAGAPTVVTTASSLPEVVGNAALMVPPGDASALAEALRHLLTDDTARQALARRGPTRAARFTWDSCAAAVEHAYARAAQATSPR